MATLGLVQPFAHGLAFPEWIPVTSPAAGATASVTVDGRWQLRVLAARLSITTDANVASRVVTVDYLDARGVTRLRNGAAVTVSASTTAQTFEFSANRTTSEWNTGTPVFAPLASFFLMPGFTVKFNVDNIQVGDQISGLSLWVEQFQTGGDGYDVGPGFVKPTG